MLTPRQQAFVREYMRDHNATQAAIRAGYAESGARVTGHRLLTNVAVQAAISAAEAWLAAKMDVSQECVVAELRALGLSNLGQYVRAERGGRQVDWDAALADPDIQRAIAEIEINEHGVVTRVKLHNKIAALSKLAEVLGYTVKRQAVDATVKHTHEVTDEVEARRLVEEAFAD